MEIEIPVNTTADILLPNARLSEVLEGNQPLVFGDIQETTEGVRLTVGSGSYQFRYRNERGLKPRFCEDTRL